MPRLINIGAVQINAVTDNAAITVGDSTSGDTFIHQKMNKGFGMVFGNANLIPANLNIVCDTDVIDQISGSQYHFRPNVASPRAHF